MASWRVDLHAKAILLLYAVFRAAWKGIDLGTLSTVNQHSLPALAAGFTAAGIPASAAHIAIVFIVIMYALFQG